MNRNSKRFVFTLSRRLNYLETKLACGNHSATEADYLRAEISALRFALGVIGEADRQTDDEGRSLLADLDRARQLQLAPGPTCSAPRRSRNGRAVGGLRERLAGEG